MKPKRSVPALITLLFCVLLQAAPLRAAGPLDEKLSLARYLLENQATPEKLKGQNHYGFGLDGIAELGYSLKNATGEVVQAYIQQTSRKVFFVEFYEIQYTLKQLLDYLPSANYLWVGSEKGCDYLNNGHLALTLCPHPEKGVHICVNLMPR